MKTLDDMISEAIALGRRMADKVHSEVDNSAYSRLRFAAYAIETLAVLPSAILAGAERIARAIEDRP